MLCYVMSCYVFWAFVDQFGAFVDQFWAFVDQFWAFVDQFWAFVDQCWAFVDQFWATAAAARREQYFQAVQPQDTHMHRDEISRSGIKSLTLIYPPILYVGLMDYMQDYCIICRNIIQTSDDNTDIKYYTDI